MALFKRGKVWWMRFNHRGQQVRKPTGTSDKKLAEKIYYKVMTEVAEGKFFEVDEARKHTFDEMMDKFLKEYAPLVSMNQQVRYKVSLKNLKPFLCGLNLSEITPRLISEYQQKRLRDGVTPATTNRERDVISKAFNLAVKQWEWCKDNPCQKVPKLQENNTIERYLLPDEEIRLLQACMPFKDLADVVNFALNTGFRLGEMLNLKWTDVDMFKRTISISITKNKQPRTIPMNDTVYMLLTNRNKVRNISGFVFSYKERQLQKDFEKACKAAQVVKFRFHDLRHTAASRMSQAGVDLYTVAKVLGHKSIVTTQRYAHLNTESLKEPLKVLDNFKAKVR